MTDRNLADWTMVAGLIERAGTRTPDYADDAIAMTARVRSGPPGPSSGGGSQPAAWSPALRLGVIVALLALALLAAMLVWAALAAPRPRSQPLGHASPATARSRSRCAASPRVVMPCASVNPEGGAAPGIGHRRTASPAPAGSVIGFLAGRDPPRLPRARGGSGEVLCNPPEVSHLYVSAADGSRAMRLTDDLARVTGASWSPDGRHMAVSFRDRGARNEHRGSGDGRLRDARAGPRGTCRRRDMAADGAPDPVLGPAGHPSGDLHRVCRRPDRHPRGGRARRRRERERCPARGRLVAGRAVDRLRAPHDPELVGNEPPRRGHRWLRGPRPPGDEPREPPDAAAVVARRHPDRSQGMDAARRSVGRRHGGPRRSARPPRTRTSGSRTSRGRPTDGWSQPARTTPSSRPPTGRSASTTHGSS